MVSCPEPRRVRRHALLLTPSSQGSASSRTRLSPFLATHPKNQLVSPIIATLPEIPFRKSFACHTCDPLPHLYASSSSMRYRRRTFVPSIRRRRVRRLLASSTSLESQVTRWGFHCLSLTGNCKLSAVSFHQTALPLLYLSHSISIAGLPDASLHAPGERRA
jgi:hypothetical protein